MSREKLDVPEELRNRIETIWGGSSMSNAEMYRMALWYAVEQYEASHGAQHETDTGDE